MSSSHCHSNQQIQPVHLGDYENRATAQLTRAGVDSPRLCAQAILGHVLGLSRLQCVLEAAHPLSQAEQEAALALLSRRANGEPLAHLLGCKEFYGRNFTVTAATLIPRPETELLIELALKLVSAATPLLFADLGTGSGCIAVTLACERTHWQGLALDTSPSAVSIALRNAQAWQTEKRLAVVLADMTAVPLPLASCDLVVSNPPYIAEEESSNVMDEVLRFEPHKALFSPNAGLAHLTASAQEAARLLRPGGLVLLEHGATQGAAVRDILTKQGFTDVATHRDLAGLDRVALGWKK